MPKGEIFWFKMEVIYICLTVHCNSNIKYLFFSVATKLNTECTRCVNDPNVT